MSAPTTAISPLSSSQMAGQPPLPMDFVVGGPYLRTGVAPGSASHQERVMFPPTGSCPLSAGYPACGSLTLQIVAGTCQGCYLPHASSDDPTCTAPAIADTESRHRMLGARVGGGVVVHAAARH